MAKTPTRTNTQAGYINVGITSMLYAQCQIAATECGEKLPDFIVKALQHRLHLHTLDKRNSIFAEACERAKRENRPTPKRWEFNVLMGWDT